MSPPQDKGDQLETASLKVWKLWMLTVIDKVQRGEKFDLSPCFSFFPHVT